MPVVIEADDRDMAVKPTLLLEPFRKEVESLESVVFLWLAPESKRGATCGSRSIVRLRIGVDYATRAI
jgi:hypothetical protein